MNKYFRKLNISISDAERSMLYEYQRHLVYTPFYYDGKPDGHYVSREWSVPRDIQERFKTIYEYSHSCVFLKNSGNVAKHYDINRFCSITVPLNYTETCTHFWENDKITVPSESLYHRGDIYLQNNKIKHSVDASDEPRHFLQFSYKNHTYDQIVELLNDYW